MQIQTTPTLKHPRVTERQLVRIRYAMAGGSGSTLTMSPPLVNPNNVDTFEVCGGGRTSYKNTVCEVIDADTIKVRASGGGVNIAIVEYA